MVGNQMQAEEYHRGRFGEMAPLLFATAPDIERPASYIRGKSRTDWLVLKHAYLYLFLLHKLVIHFI